MISLEIFSSSTFEEPRGVLFALTILMTRPDSVKGPGFSIP
jgi:hypothetical protein